MPEALVVGSAATVRVGLEAEGFTVVTAAALGPALARIRAAPPAVVVVVPPVGDLAEATVITAIRSLPGGDVLPIRGVGSPTASSQVPVHDPGPLAAMEAAAPGITATILAAFAADLRTAVQHLRAAVARHDDDALARLAHRLKGGGGSIGACAVGARAADLLAACRAASGVQPAAEALIAHAEAWLAAMAPHR